MDEAPDSEDKKFVIKGNHDLTTNDLKEMSQSIIEVAFFDCHSQEWPKILKELSIYNNILKLSIVGCEVDS
jgi:hypothetical protein